MEKLSLYERLLKNKNKLKMQAVSLVLATTAIISAGCTPSEKPTPDDTKPSIEDVIDNNDNENEEVMTPVTVGNLDFEAEKITNMLIEKGIDVNFEDVRSTLLHLNKDSFTDEEYYSLFEVNETEQIKVISVLNGVLKYNNSSIRNGKANDLVSFKIFCRNINGYKIIEKFDQETSLVAKVIVDNPKNLDSEIRKNLESLNNFLDIEQITIDGETFNFEELDDGTKILISYFGLTAKNYVNYSCDSEYLTDETKQFCERIDDLSFILSVDSFDAMTDNTSKTTQMAK